MRVTPRPAGIRHPEPVDSFAGRSAGGGEPAATRTGTRSDGNGDGDRPIAGSTAEAPSLVDPRPEHRQGEPTSQELLGPLSWTWNWSCPAVQTHQQEKSYASDSSE